MSSQLGRGVCTPVHATALSARQPLFCALQKKDLHVPQIEVWYISSIPQFIASSTDCLHVIHHSTTNGFDLMLLFIIFSIGLICVQ